MQKNLINISMNGNFSGGDIFSIKKTSI
ncbi:hypothetical protein BGLA2_420104 [Burkholderia gladioli]|nr:hypothetical protein BGLA2_420104 [Burkholderia gladioli]